MTNNNVYLHQVATEVPKNSFTQEYAYKEMSKFLKLKETRHKELLRSVYNNSGISRRHSVISDFCGGAEGWESNTFFPRNPYFSPEPSTKSRNDLFISEARRLARDATEKLFNKLPELDREKISHLISVSCTGFAAPGIDFYVMKDLELSPSLARFNIGFMGCYASFPALRLASDICRADSKAKVLIVNTELCSLHIQLRLDPEIIVTNALFSDGVSAAIVSSDETDSNGEKIILHNFMTRYVPNTEEKMTWKIGDTGFDMRLSSYVPKLLEYNIKPVINEILSKNQVTKEDIDIWAIHPGGRAIVENIQKAMDLSADDVEVSYEILREYGNMSSATIMFIMEKIFEKKKFGKMFSAAFGPGLTVESGYFEKVH